MTSWRAFLQLQQHYGIGSAFWVGGEPCLRPALLRAAMALFSRNAIATSAMVPIPDDLDSGLLISIDGFTEQHDALRGSGAFARAIGNIRQLPRQSFALSTTLTRANATVIDDLPALVDFTGAIGVLVGFHVASSASHLTLSGQERADLIKQLLALKVQHPDVLLNTSGALTRFYPTGSGQRSKEDLQCVYHDRAIAFDAALRPKAPCTFGTEANCASCGCPVIMEHRERDEGNPSADGLLRALFPKRRQVTTLN